MDSVFDFVVAVHCVAVTFLTGAVGLVIPPVAFLSDYSLFL